MRASFVRCLTVLVLPCAALLASAAIAKDRPVSMADQKSARAVIEAQLDAFAADDGKRAFAQATPAIQRLFGSPGKFMAMVRVGYPVLMAPVSVVFFKPVWGDAELVQRVQLTDADGDVWLAVYRLQRQAGKSWRIGGCVVVASEGLQT